MHCRAPCSAPRAAPGATKGGSETAWAGATPWAAQSCHESLSELEPSGRPSRAPPATGCGHGGPGRAGGPVAPAAWQSRDWRRRPAPKRPPGACVARRRPLSVVYEYEMMPEHARWFAGSAEGLAEAYAAAGRPPRAEGPRRRRLGVRVQRVARKGRFAPPGLAGWPRVYERGCCWWSGARRACAVGVLSQSCSAGKILSLTWWCTPTAAT